MSEASAERRNVTRLIRVLAVFVLVPTLSIGGVMLWDPGTRSEHILHASGFAILAVLSVIAIVQAPRMAARFVHEDA